MHYLILFYFLLFIVSFLYSSVGHGGASGYLALMALFAISPDVMKPTALLLNLFVSLVSFVQFFRGKHFRWEVFLPFAIASVPMAFVGGLTTIHGGVYKIILGLLLLIPIIHLLFFLKPEQAGLKKSNTILSLGLGAIIGLLSGLIGIGGGIILSPVILLLKWTDIKQTAAISALFIFVNSMAALGGLLTRGVQFSPNMYIYVLIAILGGIGGAYFGSRHFKQSGLKYILALVLIMASYKLLFTTA